MHTDVLARPYVKLGLIGFLLKTFDVGNFVRGNFT